MTTTTYILTEDTISSYSEVQPYICYGIKVMQENKVIRQISDIFTDKAVAEDFIRKCNELCLEPIHLNEVIEDILA